VKPKLVKLMALAGNLERKHAYMAALTLSNRAYELFGIYVGLFGGKNIPRFLRLIAAAWEEKPSKFDLTPTGLAIIKAWSAAYGIAGRGPNGFEVLAKPTLFEIKTQYAVARGKKPPADQAKRRKWLADLERGTQIKVKHSGRNKYKFFRGIPADQTFRKTLRRVKLPYC
jgi:hypothetical protein